MEPARGAGLLPAAFVQHPTERAVFDDDDVGAAVGPLPHCEPHHARQIGHPVADIGVIFYQKLTRARVDVDAVDVVQRRIAVVDADDDLRWRCLGNGIDDGADALHRSQVARRWNAGCRFGVGGGVDREDVIVLGSTLVLHEQHVAAVLGPEVTAQRPPGVGGQRSCGVEWRVDRFDPDVHDARVRLAEGDPFAVGRELRAGDLGVAEKHIAIDQGRHLVEPIRIGGGDSGGKREGER